MGRKHFDNKRDILREMKENRIRAETFVDAMGTLEKRFEGGNITLAQIMQRVFDDYGMIIELPEVK